MQDLKGAALLDTAKQQNWGAQASRDWSDFPQVVAQLLRRGSSRWTTDLGDPPSLARQADVVAAFQAPVRERAKVQRKASVDRAADRQCRPGRGRDERHITIKPTELAGDLRYQHLQSRECSRSLPYGAAYSSAVLYQHRNRIRIRTGSLCGQEPTAVLRQRSIRMGMGTQFVQRFDPGQSSFCLHRYGFADFHGGPFRGASVRTHNPEHRLSMPYPINRALSDRYRGRRGIHSDLGAVEQSRGFGGARAPAAREGGGAHFGSQGFEQQNPAGSRGIFGEDVRDGRQSHIQSDHRSSTMHGGGFGGGASPSWLRQQNCTVAAVVDVKGDDEDAAS